MFEGQKAKGSGDGQNRPQMAQNGKNDQRDTTLTDIMNQLVQSDYAAFGRMNNLKKGTNNGHR